MSLHTRPRPETLQKAVPPSAKTWFLYDIKGQVLGRAASRIARVLMGKHRPTYAPQVDNGDFVVVLNAKDVRLTGKKRDTKRYYWNTGYPSGLRTAAVGEVLKTKPEQVVELAIQRMLPKTRLGERMLKKLKVYPAAEHPHDAKRLVPLELS